MLSTPSMTESSLARQPQQRAISTRTCGVCIAESWSAYRPGASLKSTLFWLPEQPGQRPSAHERHDEPSRTISTPAHSLTTQPLVPAVAILHGPNPDQTTPDT